MADRRAWLHRLGALLAGLAAGLAHPPFGLLPGLLGYALLLALLQTDGERPLRSALLRGWLAGVGYFSVGVWWVVEPFMVDAANQGWMAPFALVLMAGGLALFWGAASLVYRALAPVGDWRVLVFAGALAGFEWLRGHIFTGFPWNLPGETWAAGSAPSQAASVLGAYGLTWLTVAIAAAPAVLAGREGHRARGIAIGLAALTLAGLYGFGLARLQQAPAVATGPLVRIVQADIDQKTKWRAENLPAIFQTYADLSRQPAARRPEIVIWPEGALPAVIDRLIEPGSPYAPLLRDVVGRDQVLLMGANRMRTDEAGQAIYHNALVAFRRDADGLRVAGIYDKHRLVPFGEFLPFGSLATKLGIRSLVHMPSDFTPGPEPRPIQMAGAPAFQPLICYEALFPGFTRQAARRAGVRPAFILNISNDAWFGVTSGPLQHLNIASYRAIEEGLPILRATPTGVSAVIDAMGRIVPGARLNAGELGVIDQPLPAALRPTLYHQHGDRIFLFLMAVSLIATVAGRTRRR